MLSPAKADGIFTDFTHRRSYSFPISICFLLENVFWLENLSRSFAIANCHTCSCPPLCVILHTKKSRGRTNFGQPCISHRFWLGPAFTETKGKSAHWYQPCDESMASVLECPLFFSNTMITTSSRLQHLDRHFSLHTRLSDYCNHASSKPQVGRAQTAPAQLPTSMISTKRRRSSSSSSTSSDTVSFYSAISSSGTEEHEQQESRHVLETGSEEAKDGEEHSSQTRTICEDRQEQAIISSQTKRQPPPPVAATVTVQVPLSQHKQTEARPLDRRRPSTTSEPLPSSAIPRRRSSTNFRKRRQGQDLIAFHRDSCRLFQSLGGTLAADHNAENPVLSRPKSLPASRAMSFSDDDELPLNQESTTLASRPGHRHIISTMSLPTTIECEESTSHTRAIRPSTATVLSWTSAETRQREYEKIDSAHSGLRGLWKKLTPKWCHGRNTRRNFFEGKCDGDSVRRYRVEGEESRRIAEKT